MVLNNPKKVLSLAGPILSIIGILVIIAVLSTGCDDQPQSGSPPTGAAVYNAQGAASGASANCGDYGAACCSGGYCDYGECQGGKCIHCGYFGESCCQQSVDKSQCEWGSVCTDGVCKTSNEYTADCGHIGYPPCFYDGGYFCYYGILDTRRNVCLACGDYEQPCCTYTDYPCDYGTCTVGYPGVGGVCRRTQAQAASAPQAQYTPDSYNYQPQPAPTRQSAPESCGHEGEPCCVDFRALDPTRYWEADPPCFDGLECWDSTCVDVGDGPDFETYDRNSGGYY